MTTKVNSRITSISRRWPPESIIPQISPLRTKRRSSPGISVQFHLALVMNDSSLIGVHYQVLASMSKMFCNWRNQCRWSDRVQVLAQAHSSKKICPARWHRTFLSSIQQIQWEASHSMPQKLPYRQESPGWSSPCTITSRDGHSSRRSPKFPFTELKKNESIFSMEAVKDWNTR